MFNRWIRLPSGIPCLLLGSRRAGKSTLLQSRYPDYKYVTLDDIDDLVESKNDPKGFVLNLGDRFVIDEIQRNPVLTLPLKTLIDRDKSARFFITGSAGLTLRDAASDTLAGRVHIAQLPPCCFGEQMGEPLEAPLSPALHREAQVHLNRFLRTGGFPEVLGLGGPESQEELLRRYRNTYFTRDVAMLSNLENIEGLIAIFQALIRGVGSRYEVSALQKESGLSFVTVKKYMHSLLNTSLIFKVYGYHLGPAKRYISSAKTYFIDNGIMTSLSDELSVGQLFENFIVSEIEKRRQLGAFLCEELYYYQSTGGAEIDLIIEEKKRILAIKIKSTKSVTRSDLRNLREFESQNNKELIKVLIHNGSQLEQLEDGIWLLPASAFYRRWNPFDLIVF